MKVSITPSLDSRVRGNGPFSPLANSRKIEGNCSLAGGTFSDTTIRNTSEAPWHPPKA